MHYIIKKSFILLMLVFSGAIFNSCRVGETGPFFIPNFSYSGEISNAALKVLEVTAHEGTTGSTVTAALTPAFNPATGHYTIAIEALVTDVTVVAVADDQRSAVQIDTKECTSRQITMSEDSRTVEIIVTAPDSSTTKTYTIYFTRNYGIDENRLLNFEVFSDTGGSIAMSPAFEPDTNTYQLRVAWNSYYVKVRPTLISSFSILKLDGSAVSSGEKELVILDGIAIGDTGDTQNIVVSVKSSSGIENTYTITVSRLAKAAVTGDNPYLSSIRVVMGNNESVRQIYQDQDGNFFPDNSDPYNQSVGGYSCVVFGYSSVRVILTPCDTEVSSLVVDSVERKGDLVSGKLTLEPAWAPGDYSIKTYAIHVVSKNGGESMDYTFRLRLLNIYEMFYGIYGPVARQNKASWGSPGTPNWSKTFNGSISGSMAWKLSWVQTLSTVLNEMTYTSYDNGDWDMPFVGDNGGFMLNGVMSVVVNTSGSSEERFQTGTINMLTPEGDAIAVLRCHYVIREKNAVSRNATSYTTVDYMGQTGVVLYYDANPDNANLGSDYWDPDVPWTGNDFWHP
jgi:hypothetical protein